MEKELRLLPLEQTYSRVNGVWNLSSEQVGTVAGYSFGLHQPVVCQRAQLGVGQPGCGT